MMNKVEIDADTLASIVSKKATGITAHFELIRNGSEPNQPSPLYRDKGFKWVSAHWNGALKNEKTHYPRLVAYEKTRWSKVGQQGGYPPLDERWDQLEAYFNRMSPADILNSSEYDDIILTVRTRLFGKHSLRALTPQQVLHRDTVEDKLNSNSGCPDYGKRSDEEIQILAVRDAESGRWKIYPAILGSRALRQKPRFIFMFPMSTNLVEKCYVIPIMDAIRDEAVLSFAAWEGFDEVELALDKQQAFTARFCASMDYTGMDQTMGTDQMQIVYDVVAPIFQPKYREGLKESLFHAINIPIMIDDKTMLTGTHGLASGSGWTNLSESIMSEFVHELINRRVKLTGNQLLGDDGAMTYNDNIDFGQVIFECSKSCGLEANPEKQDISEYTLHYLQRFFDKSILIPQTNIVAGSYPTVLAINAGMYPERFHDPKKWNYRMEILRWIMILENCKHHPMFHQIVNFFIKGDKYRLGLAIPGYFKRYIIQDYKVAKTINGFVPTYTTAYQNRGIEDFEVVKYLKTLR